MKKKILAIFLVFAAIAFGFYVLSGKRFQKTSVIEQKTEKAADSITTNDGNDISQDNVENNIAETAPNIDVKPSDCDNDCRKFTKDNEKEYCQEICGTTTFFEDAAEEGGSSDDCANEKGIQKDYCLKDIAVGNKDFKTCNEIVDSNIKKSCQNRITEDILEEQATSSETPTDY